MADLATLIPAVGASGVLGWVGNAALQWFQSREKRKGEASAAEVAIIQNRDKLTLELLATARSQVEALNDQIATANAELAIGRSMQGRLAHFEEALDHIALLLAADGADEKKASERRATAFLKRMRRLAEAEGTLRNELQVGVSANALGEDIGAALAPRGIHQD